MHFLRTCAGALALLLLSSCGGAPTEPEDFEFGRVDVYTRNSEGQPVNGVPVRLERLSGQVEDAGGLSGSVGAPGYYFFLKTGGSYRVVIDVPAQYHLGSQSASMPVEFARDETRTITYILQPK